MKPPSNTLQVSDNKEMTNIFPKIKDPILYSGLPFEISVSRMLKKHGLTYNGEQEYYRDGKYHSTDLYFYKEFRIMEDLNLDLCLLIECKYKQPDHPWVFFKTGQGDLDRNLNMISDEFFTRIINLRHGIKHINLHEFSSKNLFGLPKVDRGLEIIRDSRNKCEGSKAQIREAVSQASYGSITAHLSSIESTWEFGTILFSEGVRKKKYDLTKEPEGWQVATLTVPMVVTTAPIYVVTNDICLEAVNNKDDLNLLDKPGVCFIRDYSRYDVDFMEEAWDKIGLEIDRDMSDEFTMMRYMGRPDPSMLNMGCLPGAVYILNYYHMDIIISSLLRKIRSNVKKEFECIKQKVVLKEE